jgi:hypothetical protein
MTGSACPRSQLLLLSPVEVSYWLFREKAELMEASRSCYCVERNSTYGTRGYHSLVETVRMRSTDLISSTSIFMTHEKDDSQVRNPLQKRQFHYSDSSWASSCAADIPELLITKLLGVAEQHKTL